MISSNGFIKVYIPQERKVADYSKMVILDQTRIHMRNYEFIMSMVKNQIQKGDSLDQEKALAHEIQQLILDPQQLDSLKKALQLQQLD